MNHVNLLTRRRLLQFTGGSCLGLSLGGLWRAQAASPDAAVGSNTAARRLKPIRACILVFYYGGPSHLDTYDLKPNAPAEVRGEFRPISTSTPGIQVCEHLPRMARVMHHVALVRSVTHAARLHDSASIHALTGRPLDGPDRELFAPQPQFYPSYGSAVAFARGRQPAAQRENGRPTIDVSFASLPFAFHNVVDTPCQGGGFLSSAYDPLPIDVDVPSLAYQAEMLQRAQGIAADRLGRRRQLAESLDPRGDDVKLRNLYDKAYRLLSSDQLRKAVDIAREPRPVRERYGFGQEPAPLRAGGGAQMGFAAQMRGQNLLLARRLVEAGVPFVNVYDFKQQGQNWDAHARCAEQHKNHLLPPVDRALAALIEDLDARGLLESTLVVAMGEFGRTPTINREAGRDHWPDCYTVLFAGGGVQGGAVYGASDRIGAYPASDAVTPGDLAATVYWRFGIDPALEIRDPSGRPHRLASGEPLHRLFKG